jgi:multidrug resistance protein, MATE family
MIFNKIIQRWSNPGGYHETLIIAFPLIMSTSSWSILMFVDRLFLTWFSEDSIAASVPAGVVQFTAVSLFLGTAMYVSTFVAQYFGSNQKEKIGGAVWQGIYFSFSAMVFMLLLIPLAGPIFSLANHSESIQILERKYFTILCFGGFFPVASAAISSFFSGLGRTWTVMWVNFIGVGINIILDYALIFGKFGFPEMGIEGAAIASVIGMGFTFSLFLMLFLRSRYRIEFGTWKGRRFNFHLFKRLIVYGLPNGIQFFLSIFGYTFFIMMVGRYGVTELAATNITLSINNLAFMPLVGLGIATSVMVGQNLGNNNPQQAEYSVWSAFHIGFAYSGLLAVLYLTIPGFFLAPFGKELDPDRFREIAAYSTILLQFVAIYSMFDAVNFVFSAAIKGAGDTRFVMKMILILSTTVLIIPAYLVVEVFELHLFYAWACMTTYALITAAVFAIRFKQGKWKKMLVIERSREHAQSNHSNVDDSIGIA